MSKEMCLECGERGLKCLPKGRAWPGTKCRRCTKENLPCSKPFSYWESKQDVRQEISDHTIIFKSEPRPATNLSPHTPTVIREMRNQSAEHPDIYTDGWKATGLSLETIEELPRDTDTGNIGLSDHLPMIAVGGYNIYAGEGHREPYPYLLIIRDKPVYPVIYDSQRIVCSLPPIINGNHSKISLNTKDVLIEMTATDRTKLQIHTSTL